MASKYVPLISSGVAGPLGVLHLPRLWQKLILSSKGVLAEGYDGCGQGYDQMVIDALGLNRDVVIKFVAEKLPTYTEFEKWIIQQKGGKLDRAAIQKVNDAIRGYNHKDEVRKSILSASGLNDDGSIKD